MASSGPGIISFWHGAWYPGKEVVEKILAYARTGKKLGLEITMAELKKYDAIWARPDFQEIFRQIREGTGSYGQARMRLGDIDLCFFSVATLARERGAGIVPLDSEPWLKRAGALEYKATRLANELRQTGLIAREPVDNPFPDVPYEKVKELEKTNPGIIKKVAEYNKAINEMQYIDEVAREEWMVTVARAKKVDLICTGAGHHDGIKAMTGGHTIFRDEVYPSHFRQDYERRMAKAKRIKREIECREMPRLAAPRKPALPKLHRPKTR